ncbi:ATP-dependent helicase [Salinibacterium sp. G-O1]|uniref:ATP-dependent helicase n=1 Tax=Salinibacterium sp. G-O1 TaxID=3046208 RepID=UPI0024BBADE9|nr:ATP-dependent helicase [Salinibacterium sp. G-O1]MDJ0334518.1 ATP-dependent helicase [Salinibacterium sp. G-O1]
MTLTTSESLLDGLDDQQRLACESLLGPVCLLAGAGTGKTRAITHRIAYGVATGVYPPGRVMALTFTARAAGELRGRLRALGAGGVSARTFHASALSQLNFFWPQVIGGTMPRLLEGKAKVIAHGADSLRLKLDTATLRDVAAEIEWRKTSRLSIEEYAAKNRPVSPALTLDKMVALQGAYETVKDERRQIDFEDVLLAAAGMIEAEPRVAQQVREQYRFFVVDEYQDVSPLQHDLLQLWLGPRNDVCVVGDVSQTIYSFAGASPDYLLGFGSEHEDAVVLRLEQNYRSTPSIVASANRLMRDRPGALTLRSASERTGPAPVTTAYASDSAEARAVANSIADEIARGTKPESIAVLFRINVQSQALESALGDAGVPYLVRGSSRFFDQREVKEALMLLRGATVNTAVEPLFKTVSDVLRSIGWSQEPPETRGAVRDRWDSLNALMHLAEEAPDGTTLRQFVDDLFERQAGQHEPTMSAVTLATLHSAKGLEWESVYLVGLAEGLVPISYAKDPAAVEEERRLLYVGVTRARRSLALSWSTSPQQGRAGQRSPSRFLAELG